MKRENKTKTNNNHFPLSPKSTEVMQYRYKSVGNHRCVNLLSKPRPEKKQTHQDHGVYGSLFGASVFWKWCTPDQGQIISDGRLPAVLTTSENLSHIDLSASDIFIINPPSSKQETLAAWPPVSGRSQLLLPPFLSVQLVILFNHSHVPAILLPPLPPTDNHLCPLSASRFQIKLAFRFVHFFFL